MKNNYIFLFATIILFTLSIISCDKPAGEGGTSKIKGKVYIRDYNSSFTILQDQFYAMEERVYITYGANVFYDDDIRTSYDGSYVFSNLRKGSYTVFAYSDDSTFISPGNMFPVFRTIEITQDYQTVEVPLMILLK